MDVYMFLNTEPGKATDVMESLVNEGLASRAVAVTGSVDVIAKREGLNSEELAQLSLTDIGRISGVAHMRTAEVVPIGEFIRNLPDPPVLIVPYVVGKDVVCKLVCISIEPGAEPSVFQGLHDIEAVKGMVGLTGECDGLVQIVEPSDERVAQAVWEIRKIDGVRSTTTYRVLAATELPPERG